MDYLEQLRAEAEERARRHELSEAQKAAVTRLMEMSSALGMPYLRAFDDLNRSFEGTEGYPPAAPYKGHGNGRG